MPDDCLVIQFSLGVVRLIPARFRVIPSENQCVIYFGCMRVWKITGGTFTENKADFGGFLYVEGDGTSSCMGASVVRHSGVDGGAIYAVDGAFLEWACDLVENKALVGPAM